MQIASLLPDTISIATADAAMWETPLCEAEEALIVTARDKRKREFRAGRHCAREALKAAGAAGSFLLPVGERRQPIWPDGYTASISHTDMHCVAIAAAQTRFQSVGIDIEAATPLGAELLKFICTDSEMRWLSGRQDRLLWAKLMFGIKEAIYKAHYPLVGAFIDFLDAELSLDEDAGSFQACVRVDAAALEFVTEGRFAFDEQLVSAFVGVPARSP